MPNEIGLPHLTDESQAFSLVTEEDRLKFASRPDTAKPKKVRLPWLAIIVLAVIVLGGIFAGTISRKDPGFLDVYNHTLPPGREFWFGTDTLGRDVFACIWFGGRISIFIGVLATLVSTILAAIYGAFSGMAGDMTDTVMMRFTEIMLSIPSLLLVIFLQAIAGPANIVSLALIIGLCGWFSIAKVVRTEVRQIRNSEYVLAAKMMGGNFGHILVKHLLPNFFPSIMFMVVMNVRAAILAESTLSFIGIGLPLKVISWGSMLSLAEKALLTDAWWIILIPGAVLVIFFLCLTSIGNFLRGRFDLQNNNL